ncbi:MAG: glycosyltransferase involved in cell wall biosynthesis [Desulforhopalus sp.]|jgi:glycosyltransferase involved in cell wall biosynthesis
MNTKKLYAKYSVIIPAFNRGDSIAQAIDSVLAQDLKDFEIIVCDDGSSDNTLEVLAAYSDYITLVHSDRVGPGKARNVAAALASGRYISCLDSDDYWAPWALACVDTVLKEVGPSTSVYFRPQYVSLDRDKISPECNEQVKVGVFDSYVSAPTKTVCGAALIGAIPRDIFLKVGGFENKNINSEDRDLALKISQYTKYAIVESPVCLFYREHDGQVSRNQCSNIAGWKLIGQHYHQGVYGPTDERNLSGYVASFFLGLVVSFLQKGEPGKNTFEFFKISFGATCRLLKSLCNFRKINRKDSIVLRTIVRFYFLLSFLLIFSVNLLVLRRFFDILIGFVKWPEHKAFLNDANVKIIENVISKSNREK